MKDVYKILDEIIEKQRELVHIQYIELKEGGYTENICIVKEVNLLTSVLLNL